MKLFVVFTLIILFTVVLGRSFFDSEGGKYPVYVTNDAVFITSLQYKNVIIANFVLAVQLKMNWTMKSEILKFNPTHGG